MLQRELQGVLGLAHEGARDVVRRRVFAARGLHQARKNRAQRPRRHLLRLLEHRAEHLGHVLLDQGAVRGVHALEHDLEQVVHQAIRAGALEVEHRHAQTDGGDVLKRRVRGLKRRRRGILQTPHRVHEREVHGLERLVVLVRLLGGKNAEDVAEAQRDVQTNVLREARDERREIL